MSQADVEQLLQQAIAFHHQRQFEQAQQLYHEVLEQDPEMLSALNNLGAIYLDQNRLDEAERLFQRAMTLAPGYTSACNNLGMVFERQHRWAAAEACFQQVLKYDPDHARARNNLGNVLKAQGDLTGAANAYLSAHHTAPSEPAIINNLGNCLLELGQLDDAEQCFRASLKLDALRAETYNGLGRVQQAQGQFDAAFLSYEEAARLDPSLRPAFNNMGVIHLERNEAADAITRFEQAVRLDSGDVEATVNYALALPILYQSMEEVEAYRTRFSQGLSTLCEAFLPPRVISQEVAERLADTLSRRSNFYLQYQGGVDLQLQQQYGQLLDLAVSSTLRPFSARPVRGRSRVRVGFISSLFRDHTVGKLLLGLMEGLDRNRFEVYTYYLGYEKQALTRRYEAASQVFRHLPARLPTLVEQLRGDQLDVMIYAEIAMTPVLSSVAAARVAPQQGLFWGHPVTSGLSSMDFAITAAGMEPEDGASHYSEALVSLAGVGIRYARPALPPRLRTRSDFGLNTTDVVYLSCQSLYKYLPCYDHLFAEIALRVPNARFVFLEHPRAAQITRQFQQRLVRAFQNVRLDSARFCRFLPHLKQDDYFALNQLSDVFLDTPGWSGGNTTLEALATDLPVVTWPGSVMRSRHAYAMLKGMGLHECIADSESRYIEIASGLGQDPAARAALRARIPELANLSVFGQDECVRELEDELQERGSRHWRR